MDSSEQKTSPKDSALAALAKENQVVIITDLNHYDDSVHQFMANQLASLARAGVKHLYIEKDPEDLKKDFELLNKLTRNMGPAELLAFKTSENNPYIDNPDANLHLEAKRFGIEIHPFDDRSQVNAINLVYGQESKLMLEDPSLSNSELIRLAPNPKKMTEYLNELDAAAMESPFRDKRMLENITSDMSNHPKDKAVIIVGANHTAGKNDLDERLRLAGYQTTSVAIYGAESKVNKRDADLPDTVVSSETGNFLAQKNGNALNKLNEETVPYLRNIEPTEALTVHNVLNGPDYQNHLSTTEVINDATINRRTNVEKAVDKHVFLQAAEEILASGATRQPLPENSNTAVRASVQSIADLRQYLNTDAGLSVQNEQVLNLSIAKLSTGFDTPGYAPLQGVIEKYEMKLAHNEGMSAKTEEINHQQQAELSR